MADLINVNIIQGLDGSYSATVAEYPDIQAGGASTLDELREALEVGISVSISNESGEPRRPVKLPAFVPGQVTRL